MRLLLLLMALGFLHPFRTNAQLGLPKGMHPDSLQARLQHHPAEDLSKLRMLLALADHYSKGDLSKMARYIREAKPLVTALSDMTGKAALLHADGLTLQKKHPDSALRYFEDALAINRQLNNSYGLAKNLAAAGQIYFDQSNQKRGTTCLIEAVTLMRQSKDVITEAELSDQLGSMYHQSGDFEVAVPRFERALTLYEQTRNRDKVARALNRIGSTLYNMGEYGKALEYCFRSLQIREKEGNKLKAADVLVNIGNIYSANDELRKAYEYYKKAEPIVRDSGSGTQRSELLTSLGIVYGRLRQFKPAKTYFEAALDTARSNNDERSAANILGNLAALHAFMQEPDQAVRYAEQARAIHQKLGDQDGLGHVLANLARDYRKLSDSSLRKLGIDPARRYAKARELAYQALQISQATGNKEMRRSGLGILYILYRDEKNYQLAFETFQKFVSISDSLTNDRVKKDITRKELQFEFERREDSLRFQQQLTTEQLERQQLLNRQQAQLLVLRNQELALSGKEKELQHLAFLKEQAEKQEKEQQLQLAESRQDLQQTRLAALRKEKELQRQELENSKLQRNLFVGCSALLVLLGGSIAVGWRKTRKEQKVSEGLLLNILPAEVAAELKQNGRAEARLFDEVTVLFTDFVDFTIASEQLPPQELVNELHTCFKAFDEIMAKYGIEKIKTIGDAYLAVCGLPHPKEDHAVTAMKAAQEILDFIEERKRLLGDRAFDIRIGIHSGPVVAGIVGVKKFAYDIWGDTVNTAARMEQSGEPGKINISEATYALVKDQFPCSYRGEIKAKNKGMMNMYFVRADKQNVMA